MPPIALIASTTSTIVALAVALVVLGVAMVIVAVWLYRQTTADHPVLGPLEEMSRRSWRRTDAAGRSERLDRARPASVAAGNDDDDDLYVEAPAPADVSGDDAEPGDAVSHGITEGDEGTSDERSDDDAHDVAPGDERTAEPVVDGPPTDADAPFRPDPSTDSPLLSEPPGSDERARPASMPIES